MQKKPKYIKNLFGRSAAVTPEYQNLKEIGSIGFSYILNTHNGGEVLKGIMDIFNNQGIPFTGLVVEPKRFGEAMEKLRERLDQKNIYYMNPALDR